MGEYNTEKHKHILIKAETKEKLDGVMIDMKKKMPYDKIIAKLMDLYYMISEEDLEIFLGLEEDKKEVE
ncbi:hypothetical protein UFOVP182_35 [uncultured Caudovirales phage]|uniref:Uncharacterized protein n=1 Tax=uncultured Caudovirales phage TaxID=2100421 RepID=A0A6J7WDX0_9CAUD|nr:hypothetical protein UFOVP182_35 [uncultured Caudovirales phage]